MPTSAELTKWLACSWRKGCRRADIHFHPPSALDDGILWQTSPKPSGHPSYNLFSEHDWLVEQPFNYLSNVFGPKLAVGELGILFQIKAYSCGSFTMKMVQHWSYNWQLYIDSLSALAKFNRICLGPNKSLEQNLQPIFHFVLTLEGQDCKSSLFGWSSLEGKEVRWQRGVNCPWMFRHDFHTDVQ